MEARAEETLRALTSLVQRHAVPYRFEGGVPFEFEADYRVVVVSQQQQHSSQELLLPCMLTLKLSQDLPNEATHELSRQDCVRIRSYLQKCRCHANSHKSVDVFNVPLSKHLLELAQHEFLDKRAEYRKKKERMETVGKQVEEDDLHRWLTLARLQARSRIPPSGSCGLSDENDTERQVWADTLRLDEAMRLSIS
jgi:DNA polymerase III psi subunit